MNQPIKGRVNEKNKYSVSQTCVAQVRNLALRMESEAAWPYLSSSVAKRLLRSQSVR